MASWLKKLISYKLTMDIVLIFLLLVIMFISIWTRALIGSKKNFAEGEQYFNEQQYIKAITYFDRSMHWYAPLNTYLERSARYLLKISEKAEEINDNQLSMIAIETIRSSFYSSRSFYSPGSDWIKRCDDKIRDITKNQGEKRIKGEAEFGGQDKIYRQDIVYNDPSIFWTIILEIGLFGWIGSVLGLIYFSLGSNNKNNKYVNTYWLWIMLSVFSYGLWIIAMMMA